MTAFQTWKLKGPTILVSGFIFLFPYIYIYIYIYKYTFVHLSDYVQNEILAYLVNTTLHTEKLSMGAAMA